MSRDHLDTLGGVGRIVHQTERADQDVPVNPRVPVVHVAVEADPVPVPPPDERIEDARARLVPDARPQSRIALVESRSEQMIEPGELADDLAGTEIQERIGDGGQYRAVPSECVVVCGPAPRRLLAQEHDSVGDLVDPSFLARSTAAATTARLSRCWRANAGVSQTVRSPSRCTRAAALASGTRPRLAEVGRGAAQNLGHGRAVRLARRGIPHRTIDRRRNRKRPIGRQEYFLQGGAERVRLDIRLPCERGGQQPCKRRSRACLRVPLVGALGHETIINDQERERRIDIERN